MKRIFKGPRRQLIMTYIYSNATRPETFATLEATWPELSTKTVFEYLDGLGADLIRIANRLPFTPRVYIQANLLEDEAVHRMASALASANHKVVIEDGLGKILTPEQYSASIVDLTL
jgi:hypothetical protein